MEEMENHHQIGGGELESGRNTAVAVVMVPYSSQGHLNQLLHLSRLISAYKIDVYYTGTTTHNRQAEARVQGWDPRTVPNLIFYDFPTPPFSNLSPDPNSYNNLPSHLDPMMNSLRANMGDPLLALANKLSATYQRVVVIYDSLMGRVVKDVCSVPNTESYRFQSVSPFSIYGMHCEVFGETTETDEILGQLPPMEESFFPGCREFVRADVGGVKFHSGTIFNSSRIIEGLYLDLLAKAIDHETSRKTWAIGPLNPMAVTNDSKSRHKCLDWLDKQPPNSVMYVSFGSTTSLPNEQIEELALGLERSNQKFVWALREADKGDIFDSEVNSRRLELPRGFEERVKERGVIVRDWAPQLEILGHFATGGFMSHCGWNSCTESLSMGIPLATWPMHSDQPRNAVLVNKLLRVGVEVKEWARRGEVVSASTVEEAVRKLMASVEGDEIRKRAKVLGDALKKSWMEGEATHKEMDSFILHITR